MKLKKTILAAILLATVSASAMIPLTACGGDPQESDVITEALSPEEEGIVIPDAEAGVVKFSEENYMTTPSSAEISIDEETMSLYVNNVVLVYAQVGASQADVETLAEKYDLSVVGAAKVIDFYQLRTNKAMTRAELEQLIGELEAEDLIDMACVDQVHTMETETEPNDPWKGKLTGSDQGSVTIGPEGWSSENPAGSNWGAEAINAMDAWEYVDQMSPIRVAVMDDAIETHEDIVLFDQVDASWKASLKSQYGNASHGNHVSGIIMATANNNKGITGICPVEGTKLIFCGIGNNASTSAEISSLAWLVSLDTRVINYSYRSISPLQNYAASHGNESALNAIKEEAESAAKSLRRLIDGGYDQFIVCASAGNSNDDVFYKQSLAKYGYLSSYQKGLTGETPHSGGTQAAYNSYFNAITDETVKDHIIVVGSAGMNENGTYYYADYSCIGDRVDIVAPGEDILSCVTDNEYKTLSGTSQATPHVAGVAAMVFGCNPDLTGAEVKEILVTTADYSQSFDGVDAGFLQADKAVEFVLKTGAYSQEKQTGLVNFMDMTYEEMMPNVDELYFTETMDEPGVWYATGYYEEKASLSFKLSGADSVGGCQPVSMTVSALNNAEVRITEDIVLGMEYYEAEMLNNVTTIRQSSDEIIMMQTTDNYEITMTFTAKGLESSLKTVTIEKTE